MIYNINQINHRKLCKHRLAMTEITMITMMIAHRIELVIMQGLQMDDKTIHIVKLRSVSVALMVELTMKDSYQVVYQGKEKTSFHAKN
jgi:hypothetical protein